MKATIDKDGKLTIDMSEVVESMSDEDKRTIAKYAVFNEVLLTGILEALVHGTMWLADEDGPWWFGGDTFNKLRLQLLPLLPDITAEAVRRIDAELRATGIERDRWRDACWALERDWPEGRRERKLYEYRDPLTKEEAAAYLRELEQKLGANRG